MVLSWSAFPPKFCKKKLLDQKYSLLIINNKKKSTWNFFFLHISLTSHQQCSSFTIKNSNMNKQMKMVCKDKLVITLTSCHVSLIDHHCRSHKYSKRPAAMFPVDFHLNLFLLVFLDDDSASFFLILKKRKKPKIEKY